MAKVIRGGNMFFEDDIQIIDSELDAALSLPAPPIFSRDELQIGYNGHVYVASKTPQKTGRIKVYTMTFGLKEVDSPKVQEDKYFSDNSDMINKQKQNFIERVVNGITEIDPSLIKSKAGSQISQELSDRISKVYEKINKPQKQNPAGKGLITKLDDGSVFNSEMQGCERVLILDRKIYDLLTIPEYVSIFQNSFEPTFYKKLEKDCTTLTPQEVSEIISKNTDKIHRKVVPKVRNKIWHSNHSGEIYLDGTYWIPHFRSENYDGAELYQKLLEKKIKVEAARSIKW